MLPGPPLQVQPGLLVAHLPEVPSQACPLAQAAHVAPLAPHMELLWLA